MDSWIKDRNPTKAEIAYAGDTGFILCVNGKRDNMRYENAIVMGDCFYEDDKWYVNGIHSNTIQVLGFMLPPTWED